ncbi:MAG: DUF1631 family protein [Gammaproteobacteria bacterium]|jgi:hypothetical protein
MNAPAPSPKRVEATLQGATQNLLKTCFEGLLKKAQDPGFRMDPEASNLFLRGDALDALLHDKNHVLAITLNTFTDSCIKKGETKFDIDDDLSQLALLDDDLLDLTIAISRHAQRATDRNKEPLLHLELRLEELDLYLPNGIDPHCMHPDALYNSLQQGMDVLDLQVSGKVLLYDLFAAELLPRLADFYAKLNEHLAQAGYLPDNRSLQEAIRARELANRQKDSEVQNGLVMPSGPDDTSAGIQVDWAKSIPVPPGVDAVPTQAPDLYSNVQPVRSGPTVEIDAETLKLLKQQLQPMQFGAATPADLARAEARQKMMVRALTRAQTMIVPEIPEDTPLDATRIKAAFSEAVEESGDAEAAKDFKEVEDKVIDFVNDIFLGILENDALSDAVKALLSRLQIPVIKLALTDFGFFQNPQHPARRVLNELVALGIGVQGRDDPLFEKLQGMVNNLLRGNEADTHSFEQVLARLRKIERIEQEQASQEETLARQEAQVRARRSAAKRVVVRTMNRHLRDKRMADEALQFILKCWAPHMALIYLRDGLESEAWQHAVQALRQIIEASQPDRSIGEIEGIIGSVEGFFDQVEGELQANATLKASGKSLLGNVRNWFFSFFAEKIEREEQAGLGELDEIASGEPEVEIDISPQPEDQVDEQRDVFKALMEAIPAEVRPGAWFEIYRGPEHSKRTLKLSVILEDSGQVLFADRAGRAALEIELATFIEDLREGRSRCVEDNNLFDAALSAVISNIQQNQSRQNLVH